MEATVRDGRADSWEDAGTLLVLWACFSTLHCLLLDIFHAAILWGKQIPKSCALYKCISYIIKS